LGEGYFPLAICHPFNADSDTVTNIMPSQCPFCSQSYVYAASYRKHIRTYHSDLAEAYFTRLEQRPSAPVSNLADPDGALGDSDCESDESSLDNNDKDSESDGGGSRDNQSDGEESDGEYGKESDGEDGNESHGDSDADGEPELSRSLPGQRKQFLGAGLPLEEVLWHIEHHEHLRANPWDPFQSEYDFKLASWILRSKVSKARISEFFNVCLSASTDVSFKSAYLLERQIARLDPQDRVLLEWKQGVVTHTTYSTTFWYRSPVDCVQFLLQQKVHEKDLVYSPVQDFDSGGARIYSEMHTADWWWETQVYKGDTSGVSRRELTGRAL
jgi:hypothetical protein